MNQPYSYIHPQAEVADNVVVEPFVTISKNVSIGEGSWIGSHVTIMEGARIGKELQNFSRCGYKRHTAGFKIPWRKVDG